MTQESFDLDLPEQAPKKPRHSPSTKVVWSRYRVLAPVHCDDCLAEIHEAWPHGTHAPNRASWRRKVGEAVTYHCFAHAQVQRIRDGIPPGKAKRK
jgi:hypothetical protein